MLKGRRQNLLAALCGTFLACLTASSAAQQPEEASANRNESGLPKVGKSSQDCPECPEMAVVPDSRVRMGVDERPLEIDYSVSDLYPVHVRLTFKSDVLLLSAYGTNWLGDGRIGKFEASYSDELHKIREQLTEYREYWSEELRWDWTNMTVLEMTKPHPRMLSLDGKPISENHPHHAVLWHILSFTSSLQWECVDCVSYHERRNSIVRTRTIRSVGGSAGQTQLTTVFRQPRIGAWAHLPWSVTPCSEAEERDQPEECEERASDTIKCYYSGGGAKCYDSHYRWGLFRVR